MLLLVVMLPHLENPKIEMRPFSSHFSPASSSPIDPYRHWKRSDMVRRASVSATDRGGGYEAMSSHCDFGSVADSAGVVWASDYRGWISDKKRIYSPIFPLKIIRYKT